MINIGHVQWFNCDGRNAGNDGGDFLFVRKK